MNYDEITKELNYKELIISVNEFIDKHQDLMNQNTSTILCKKRIM